MSNFLSKKGFFAIGGGGVSPDGTVPLTADWASPLFGISALNLTATPTLGNEALTNVAGWTAAGNWTYAALTGWSHATGSATALTATGETAVAIGTKYEIVMTLTTSVAGGGLAVSLGGQGFPVVSATGAYTFNVTAFSTVALSIVPTSGTWVGAMTISVKILTANTGIVNAEGIVLNSGQLLLPNGNIDYLSWAFSRYPTTGIFFNQALASMDIVYNGTSVAQISPAKLNLLNAGSLTFGTRGYISWAAAGEMKLGVDAASPIDQILRAPNGVGTDKPGGMFTIQGGASTGTNDGGAVRIQTSTVSTTSSTPNIEYTRYRAVGKIVTLTDASATDVISFAVTAGQTVGGMLVYTIKVADNDASDKQVESGFVTFSGLQDSNSWHTGIAEVSTPSLQSGALATTWAIDTATANTLKITCLADSDLTTPVITLRYQLFLNSPIVETP